MSHYRGAGILTIGVCALALSLLLPVDAIIYPYLNGYYTLAIGSLVTFVICTVSSLVVIKWGCEILQIPFRRGVSLACFVSVIFSLVAITGKDTMPLIIQDVINAVIGFALLILSPPLRKQTVKIKPKKTVKPKTDSTKPSSTESSSHPIVGICAVCGKRVYLPYRCNYCGGIFCDDHILPPKHNCPGLESWKAAGRLPDGVTWDHKGSGTYYRKY